MRKLFVLLSCLFLFIILSAPGSLQAKTRTKLGVFYLPTPELFKKAQLKVTRAIVSDDKIQEIYRQLDSGKQIWQIKPLQKLKTLKSSGVDVIITLRWPQDKSLLEKGIDIFKGRIDPNSMIDRVPEGLDRERVLQLLKRFLNDFGDQIAVISLQNECLGGPGQYRTDDTMRNSGGFSKAGKWLIKVAKTVDELRRSNPKLSHLKISSPTWQAVDRLSSEGAMIPEFHEHPKIKLLGEIVKISNTYCDYVDIHLLETSLKDYPRIIAYVKKHTDLPLITTEWSGLYKVREWLQEPINPKILALIKKEFPKLVVTAKINRDLVQIAHSRKTPTQLWNKFLETMPHEKDFALRSFQLFEKEGFVYACWALGYQYNNFVFDLNTLFANMVTKEPLAPNEPAFSDFQRTIEYSGGMPWKF